MLRLKGCPRCGGDIVIDRDNYGWYEQCLHCGYERDLIRPNEVPQQSITIREKFSKTR